MKQLDEQLLLWFNQQNNAFCDFFWVFFTDKFLAIPFIGILLLFVWKHANFKTTVFIGFVLIGLVGFTEVFATLIKNFVARPRPCSVNSEIVDQVRVVADSLFKGSLVDSNAEKCEKFSFFSAHAAVSTAIAVFLAMLFKQTNKILFSVCLMWAFLVSVSRIYLGFHYPSDIFVGMIVGGLFGFVGVKVYEFIGSRFFSSFYFNPNK